MGGFGRWGGGGPLSGAGRLEGGEVHAMLTLPACSLGDHDPRLPLMARQAAYSICWTPPQVMA